MKKIHFATIVFMCFIGSSCVSKDVPQTLPVATAPSATALPPPKKQFSPVQNVNIVTPTDELCALAKNKNAAAELQIATYYDSQISQDSLGKKDATKSQKAMVAAMYWYDLAIHYGGSNPQGKDRRRALGAIATAREMELYRRFSHNKDNPPCVPVEVFDGQWF